MNGNHAENPRKTNMNALTKLDIAAFRKADTLCVHLHKNKPNGLVRLIKNADRNVAFDSNKEHVLECPVTLHGWHNRDAILDGANCFAHISFYHAQNTPASCIVNTLRVGDEISFEFYPDAHSNGNTTKAQLHADALYLIVRRDDGNKRYRWTMDVSICPDNSARMCHGVPSSEDYQQTMNAA
jgi:hypothetical protein